MVTCVLFNFVACCIYSCADLCADHLTSFSMLLFPMPSIFNSYECTRWRNQTACVLPHNNASWFEYYTSNNCVCCWGSYYQHCRCVFNTLIAFVLTVCVVICSVNISMTIRTCRHTITRYLHSLIERLHVSTTSYVLIFLTYCSPNLILYYSFLSCLGRWLYLYREQ